MKMKLANREYLFFLLSKKDYSQKELRRKLLAHGASEQEAEALLQEFAQSNYQSDERLASSLIKKLLANGYGMQKIKLTLRDHEVDEIIGQNLLLSISEAELSESARRALAKKKFFRDKTDQKRQQRDLQYKYLLTRGFMSSTIEKAIKENENE